jgi:hypothetical protein
MIRPARLVRSAIVLKPSTIMSFHRALVRRKYRLPRMAEQIGQALERKGVR